MRENKLLLLHDRRQEIHNLILRMHSSGLSPPEEEILILMEAQEGCADSEDQIARS